MALPAAARVLELETSNSLALLPLLGVCAELQRAAVDSAAHAVQPVCFLYVMILRGCVELLLQGLGGVLCCRAALCVAGAARGSGLHRHSWLVLHS